jgi:hypothetical protein
MLLLLLAFALSSPLIVIRKCAACATGDSDAGLRLQHR